MLPVLPPSFGNCCFLLFFFGFVDDEHFVWLLLSQHILKPSSMSQHESAFPSFVWVDNDLLAE